MPKSRTRSPKGGAVAAGRVTPRLRQTPVRIRAGKPVRKPASPSSKARGTTSGKPRGAAAEIRRLTAELAKARGRIRALEGLAETDVLLGILNRRGFERELNRAVAYIRRYRGTGALIVLDVDRLKIVNDVFGHAAGDALLKNIADVLSRSVRASDVLARLGGDEFAIVLWNLSEADALTKARALESTIDKLVTTFRGRTLVAGASAGVAMITTDDDAATVLERADKAMYARKRRRRPRTKTG